MHFWRNVLTLTMKELRSLLGDKILTFIIMFVFTVTIYTVANGVAVDVKNASVAVMDHDHSVLSYRIRDAILPPMFKRPVEIDAAEADEGMNKGAYTFVLDIPPNFEAELLKGHQPKIQLLIDATAMTQAGVGQVYLSRIVSREVASFQGVPSGEQALPFEPVVHRLFNPNGQSEWHMSLMQVGNNVTLMAFILAGAAVIRERERGTIEHLLVMPVNAAELMLAKIFANGLVILLASLASIWFVVHLLIGTPINGSLAMFAVGEAVYLFSAASLGILLATMAPTMPQFALLMLPVHLVCLLFSGSASPRENMPQIAQQLTEYLPMTIFAAYNQDILFRDADWSVLWPKLLILALLGAAFLMLALSRFKKMLEQQG